MNGSMQLAAPCLFGLEGIAAEEFKRMGFCDVEAQNGRVILSGNAQMLARANINSRFAERVLILLAEFKAETFTELFDGVKKIPFEDYIGKDDAFPVTGWSLQSQLHSIPDCQSIIKKAIVERLKQRYSVSWFEETGPVYQIRFSILKNMVSVMLDTSGEGLHKRGYRKNANAAPLKETLAAGICNVARIYPDTKLYDPMCGSGTVLIESALMATNRAPGLLRGFAAERFSFLPESVWREERARARDLITPAVDFHAYGFDMDSAAVELTLKNAKMAGVEKYITATVGELSDFVLPDGRFTLITNPPYGERLLDVKKTEELYRVMGQKFRSGKGKKYFIISPHDEFETHFGRKADKRRKLYNGMIKCSLFQYFKSTT